MGKWKRAMGILLSGTLAAASFGRADITVKAAQTPSNVEETVRLWPGDASVFSDTDGDGFGEFEGWGTSLCWWANRLGYSEKMTKQAGELFFGDEGLDMNIGRYNVGGGDCVGEVPANENAVIYDISDTANQPSYSGEKMKVETGSKLKEALYTASDADFGITRGEKVGNYSYIGWINALGAEPGNGGNLIYTVNAREAGNHTVKMLLSLDGSNSRGVSIRVNGDLDSDRHIASDTVNKGEIAAKDGEHLFRAVFEEVALKKGENTIAIGGNGDFTLNFVKMAVIPSGQEGVLRDEWVHIPHITRSDSAVPGYCTDVTKLTDDMTEADYAQFDRVDAECGYAWNYNWDADSNQMNILKAAASESGADFIAEAFSNSPPYFMTNSGCTSGALNAANDNLRADSYHAFAVYMADVIVHWAKEGVIDFQSASPMNEPDTAYWGAYSEKQEGCHFESGASQSKIIEALAEELKKQREETENARVKEVLSKLVLSASDETDIDKAVLNYGKLSEAAKAAVTRIDTHTYSGSKRNELRTLAENAGQNLWMSEVDGAYTAGTNAGEMTAALGLAKRIVTDLNGLRSSAWILWNAVDVNADSTSEMRTAKDHADMESLYQAVDLNGGYWGIAFGDHNNEKIVLTKKYYGYGQFTKYIRPGACIIGNSDDKNTLAVYDPKKQQAVIVAVNTSEDDKVVQYDLSNFSGMGNDVRAVRSSGALSSGENWADVSDRLYLKTDAARKKITAALKANSITTFVVDGVTYDKSQDEDASVAEIPLSANMVNGSAPWNNNTAKGPAKTVDNDLSTYFDGVGNGYVQIDLGKIYRLNAVGYAPRNDNNGEYHKRCNGAMFYGSNNGTDWTRLYTIAETPQGNVITTKNMDVWETDSNHYRYIKYTTEGTANSDKNCNVAELKLYGAETDIASLAASYEKKAAEKNFVENEKKAAFESALAAAKEMESGAEEARKEAAMAAVVAAYDALDAAEDVWDYTYDYITGVKGDPLYDTEGKQVQAHGGQVQKIAYEYDYDGDGKIAEDEKEYWYWIGEDRSNGYRPCPGIHAYISKDLYNWKDMGNVLKTVPNWETFTTDPYFTALYGKLPQEDQERIYADIWTKDNASDGGCVIERPKMLYNEKNDNYVIWFHADGQTPDAEDSSGNYSKSKAGVAVSDSPFGPFRLLGSYLLNYNPDADHGFDKETGGHVRDMNVFKDDDKTAYVLYSSDGNETMHIARLNDDYTHVAQPENDKAVEGVDFSRNFIGESREAPAMFKYHDKYYLITSGCTGWDPNRASYAVADCPLGPWTTVGDPCTDTGSDTTYQTQSTCVFPVDAQNGKFIYMGDRWTRSTLHDSRYVWIPVEFQPDSKIALRRYSNWTLSELEGKGTYRINTEILSSAYSLSDLKARLPEEITVNYDNGEEKTMPVTWSGFLSGERALGPVVLTASLSDGSSFRHNVSMLDEKMVYFFDCGTEQSEYVETAKKELSGKLRNSASDQPYEGNAAGYTGVSDTDFGKKSGGFDAWSYGYYAKENKDIEYAFELEEGEYTVSTGYQEWWNTERPLKITVSADGGTLAEKSFTLAGTDKNRQENVSFVLEESASVKVTVSKTGSPDAVLSWIAVMKDEESEEYKEARRRVETAKDSLTAPTVGENDTISLITSHENGSRITWTAPEDSPVTISQDGKTAVVVRGTEAVTVTLTARITDKTIAEVAAEKTFDILIPAREEETDPEIEAARRKLDEAIRQAGQKTEGKTEEDYTPESWDDFCRALEAAQNLSEDAGASEIDRIRIALEMAISGLTEKEEENEENKAARQRVKEACESLAVPVIREDNTILLVTAHMNGSQIAWTAPENSPVTISKDGKTAVVVRGTEAVTVILTAVVTDGIVTAIKEEKTFELVIPAEEPKTEEARNALNQMISQAKQKLEGKTEKDFTPESWAALQNALKAAENLSKDAGKAEIDDVMRQLRKAMEGLTERPAESFRKVTAIKFLEKTYSIAAGKKIDLKKELKVLPENASNPAVTFKAGIKTAKYAGVKNGVVTTKKAGAGKTVIFTAETNDGSQIKASVKIKIMKHAVKKISVKKKKLTVKAGKTVTIKPTVKTSGKKANKKLLWSSSNTNYAEVNAKGKVKTKRAGAGKTVTITAKSTDGTNKSVKVKIKLKK